MTVEAIMTRGGRCCRPTPPTKIHHRGVKTQRYSSSRLLGGSRAIIQQIKSQRAPWWRLFDSLPVPRELSISVKIYPEQLFPLDGIRQISYLTNPYCCLSHEFGLSFFRTNEQILPLGSTEIFAASPFLQVRWLRSPTPSIPLSPSQQTNNLPAGLFGGNLSLPPQHSAALLAVS